MTEIAGVTVQSDDPFGLAQRWSEVLGSTAPQLEGKQASLSIAEGKVLFAADLEGRGPGLSEIHLRARDAGRLLARARSRGVTVTGDTFEVCGTRFRLEPR